MNPGALASEPISSPIPTMDAAASNCGTLQRP